jgi:hypothetical protein
MYRSVLVGVFAGLLTVAGAGMPAFAARAAGPADLSMTVGQFKQSSLTMQVRAGQSTGIISSVNLVSGVLAAADYPPIIVDVSQASHDLTIDNASGWCTQIGTFTIRCRTDVNPTVLLSLDAAAGATPGPAGYITFRLDPPPGLDTNPANDSARLNIDIQATTPTRPSASSPTVTGTVGQVVTVPVTVTNPGPSTLSSIRLVGIQPKPGAQYVASPGCSKGGTNSYDCMHSWMVAGTSFVQQVNFRITGCGQTGAGYSLYWDDIDMATRIDNLQMRVTVACAGSVEPVGSIGGATNTPVPSATATPADTYAPYAAPPPAAAAGIATGSATGLLGRTLGGSAVAAAVAAGATLGYALRRRRRAGQTPPPLPPPPES